MGVDGKLACFQQAARELLPLAGRMQGPGKTGLLSSLSYSWTPE